MFTLQFKEANSKSRKGFLKKAVKLAHFSTCHTQHGAIIVKSGSVISVGVNSYFNDYRNVSDPTTEGSIHAEVAALKACRKVDLTGATIYVARINKTGKPMMSKPCKRCEKALRERGVKKVYYTVNGNMTLD